MSRVLAKDAGKLPIGPCLSLGFIDELGPCVGALELQAVAQPLAQGDLQRVVPGVCSSRVQIDGAPVGVGSQSPRTPGQWHWEKLPAVRQDLRNGRVALFLLSDVDAS